MKKIKTIFLTVLFFGYFVVAKNSLAATHYVRNGASGAGNGENWTDAWTSLPAVLVRGDTYYIADGSYSDYTFDDAASGNSVVVIQKATTSQHGTDSGWQASYGDGTAVFTGTISVNADYLLFDGVSGGGPGSWTSGYGFEFTSPAGTSINYFHIADAVSNITLRHIYFNQIGDTEIYTTGAAAIYNATMVYNSLFEYLYFDNLGALPFMFRGGSGNIIQYNYSGNICGMSVADINQHCEAMVIHDMDNIHFRWNFLTECPSSGCLVKNSTPTADAVRVYGNYFRDGGAIVCNSGPCTNWRVFNNTVRDVYGPVSGDGSVSGAYVYNNLIFQSSGVRPWDTHDYNWWSDTAISCNMRVATHENITSRYPSDCDLLPENADPFVDSIGSQPEDFRLTAAISSWPGTDMCALDDCSGNDQFDVDVFGRQRGADGTWDIGAYEYDDFGKRPSYPGGLSVN